MEKINTEKSCPSCNSLFECKPNDIANCFCSSIALSRTNLENIAKQYKDCLCLPCLAKYNSENNKVYGLKFLVFFLFSSLFSFAQFPGPVGSLNTTAMYKDSSAFVAWASGCTVHRGLQDISTPSVGVTNAGVDNDGTLKAGDNPVVSLGDGGYAILTFPSAIKNGTGFDFAVFENSFDDTFLELAFVEVSSDGINFFRFAATSNTQYTTQIGTFDELGDATKLNNLAGKYRVNYGTPFDLDELKTIPGLDVNAITHVKIIDVVGDINAPYATYDQNNSPINDPWPTAFASGGFDLDAVGVIHANSLGIKENELNSKISVYPNPCTDNIIISNSGFENTIYQLMDFKGALIKASVANTGKTIIDTKDLENGIYFLSIKQNSDCVIKKIAVQK
jgi:hypothetical protein